MTHPFTLTSDAEDTLSGDELARLEQRWKSDVDLKLDRLVTFADKYERLLDVLFQRELRWAKFQDAVIDKTLGALVWGGIVFIGVAAWHFVQAKILGKV